MPLLQKILRQISADKGEEGRDARKGGAQNPGKGYHRVPSHGTISASTTSASLINDYDIQTNRNLHLEFPVEEEDSNSNEEQEDFETTRLHFQKSKQPSIASALKIEMDFTGSKKDMKNPPPYVPRLSTNDLKSQGDDCVKLSINGDESPYNETTQKIQKATQFVAAVAVSLGSMVGGFTTSYTAPALITMRNSTEFSMTKEEESWVGGLMPLAALVGGIIGGWFISRFGRRNTIIAIAIPFIVASLTIALATSVNIVYVGRALGGLCVGIGSLVYPVYLGETLLPELRGQFGLIPTALGNIGMLLCYTAGYFFDWSQLAYFGAFLPVPFLLLMLIVPETPRWYISKGRKQQAKVALQWLRGKSTNIESEFKDIVKSQEETESGETFSIKDFFLWENRIPLSIAIGLMFFQQLSGINAVMFYSTSIFQSAGTSFDENLSTIIIGVVNFGATFVATFLIDRLGRKILLYISGITMILTLASLGAFFYIQHLQHETSHLGWLPLVSLVLYVTGFSLGFGPIPWLMMGEILPTKIRGTAASFVTAFNWFCTFIVTKCFHSMVASIGAYGAFWTFGGILIVGFFFTIFCVPETRGKSLEDIEKSFSRKR